MPQAAALTIKDGAATPVDHTFTPGAISAGVATFFERKDTLVARPQMTVSNRESNGSNPTIKAELRLTQPKVVNVTDTSGNTVAKVDHTDLGVVTFTFAKNSTLQERKNLRVLIANALLNASNAEVIDQGEQYY